MQVCIWCVLCFVCVGVCGRVKRVHSDEGCDNATVTRLKLPHAGASLFVYVFCGRVNVCARLCLTQQAVRVNQHALLCCHLLYKKTSKSSSQVVVFAHTASHAHVPASRHAHPSTKSEVQARNSLTIFPASFHYIYASIAIYMVTMTCRHAANMPHRTALTCSNVFGCMWQFVSY